MLAITSWTGIARSGKNGAICMNGTLAIPCMCAKEGEGKGRKKTSCYLKLLLLLCSVMSDFVAPWTVAHQAPLSMEFSRQEY